MGVNGEALQLHAVYKKQYFFTARHTRIRIRCNEIKGSYDKIIITIVPSYTRLLPLALLLDMCCALITIQTATNL